MSDNSYEGEEHFDKYDHYNYDQEKVMMSGNSGEWRKGGEVGRVGSVCYDCLLQGNRGPRRRRR